jgi:WD40 repeat protein
MKFWFLLSVIHMVDSTYSGSTRAPIHITRRLMNPSDSLQLDEHLARLLAAYDQSIEGADAKAPTIGVRGVIPPEALTQDARHSTPEQKLSANEGTVGELIPDHEKSDSAWFPKPSLTPPPVGGSHRVGRFELRRQLGKGGCGIVFLAYDPKLEREVALKIPRPEMLLSADARRRLIREALAAAEFDHPNLVPVYETGEIGPVCFIATAFCPGLTLGEWLDRQAYPVPVRQAARLVATLAEAVQHAHDRGVLHRDLKPNNVILQAIREDPSEQEPPSGSVQLRGDHYIPRVVDFGLAKLLERGGPSETMTRQVLGTPKYMAPEQAQARHSDIGPPADVYALGVILYELVTGRAPYDGASDVEILRQSIDGVLTQPRHLRIDIPRDLEAICLKAMTRSPEKRYRTAIDFADDLRRFLDGKPTLARPLKWLGRAARWLRRNDQAVGLAVVTTFAALLLVFWLMSTYQSRQLRTDKESLTRAQADRTRSDQTKEYARQVRAAYLAWRSGDSRAATSFLLSANEHARSVGEPTDFCWQYLTRLIAAERMAIICPAGAITALAASPEGAYLASGHSNGTVSLWMRATGDHVASAPAHDRPVVYLEFTKTGELISADSATSWKNWKIDANRRLIFDAKVPGTLVIPPTSLPLVRVGPTSYSGGEDGIMRAWNTSGGEPNLTADNPGDLLQTISVNRDGSLILAATNSSRILSYLGTTRQQILPGMSGSIASLQYPKEQSVFTLAIRDRVVVASDLYPDGPKERFKIQSPDAAITAAQLSADGSRVVTGDDNGMVRVWATVDQHPIVTLDTGEQSAVKKTAISDDGKRVAAQCGSRLVLWLVGEPTPRATLPADDNTVFRFVPDGSRLVQTSRGGTIKVWDAFSGQIEYTLYGHAGQVTALGASPDGRTLVSGGILGDVKFWDLRIGQESMSFRQHLNTVAAIEFSTNGKVLVTGGKDLILWQAAKE